MPTCPSENQQAIDQSGFWNSNGMNWDKHRIGWAIAGGCAILTVCISSITILQHCRSYTNRREQRQILRILYMPPVYAIISFFSYRFFRSYTYYSFAEIGMYPLLIIEYVASTASGHDAEAAIARKDKRPLPMPFCCWRYRPTKWSVLQYVIIRPAASITGIICEKFHVLCESQGFSPKFANVYIEAINFIALYGLLMFYGLMNEELKGRRPMAKFLSIKLIVMFTFYQSFMFSALEGRVIHETQYWSASNISNGLNALAICIEMVFFAILMWWAYTPAEYKRKPGMAPTTDFALEIYYSLRFFIDYARGKPSAHGHGHRVQTDIHGTSRMDFGEAFGQPNSSESADRNRRVRTSYEENIHLAPYH
ncbi:organic solute transporter Ostalpha-domain-containing protein [Infundibulicybe gibba]|nr:organic solute transporter Ostalpha-domain-containing protein [Infundibulicybe gibba]